MKKSIVFTVTTDLSHDQRMQRISETLAKAGFEVTLVGRLLPYSSALKSFSFRQHRIKCYFLKGPFFYLEYNLRLLKWLSFNRFDLYGAVDADTALAGVFISALRHKPLVYDAHELFPELPEVVNRGFVKKVWAWVEKLAFKKATLAYTVSSSLVNYFQQTYGREVHLIRNMPTTKRYSSGPPAKPLYFIYQGALNIGRGLENTIQAMKDVPAQLIICGEGPIEQELKALTSKLNLQEKVIFKGNVVPEELAAYTASAWAGIMLLDNQGLSYYYSLANKFFDYVQAGIPQVCVPFPEYQHLNEEHEVALLVNNKVEEVRTALLTLLQNKDVYRRLQQNCLRAREEWNWTREGQQLVDLYTRFV